MKNAKKQMRSRTKTEFQENNQKTKPKNDEEDPKRSTHTVRFNTNVS